MTRLPASRALACALAFTAPLAASHVAAQSLVSTGQSFAELELLAGQAGPGGTQIAGLSIALQPGWKTYWRSPGEAGVPPVIDWSASANVADLQVLWPAPEMFDSFGMRTIGYAYGVTLPLVVTPADPSQPVTLDLDVQLGVCETICVFEEAHLTGSFPAGQDGPGAFDVAAALAAVPPPASEAGVTAIRCGVRGAGQERDFEAEIALDAPVRAPVVIVEGPEEAWFGEAAVEATASGLRVSAPVSILDPDAWIDRGSLRMTLLGDGYAADLTGCAPLGS